jgi:hypothetical protein
LLGRKGKQLVPKLAALADEKDARLFGHLTDAHRQSLMVPSQEMVAHHQIKTINYEVTLYHQ